MINQCIINISRTKSKAAILYEQVQYSLHTALPSHDIFSAAMQGLCITKGGSTYGPSGEALRLSIITGGGSYERWEAPRLYHCSEGARRRCGHA